MFHQKRYIFFHVYFGFNYGTEIQVAQNIESNILFAVIQYLVQT